MLHLGLLINPYVQVHIYPVYLNESGAHTLYHVEYFAFVYWIVKVFGYTYTVSINHHGRPFKCYKVLPLPVTVY